MIVNMQADPMQSAEVWKRLLPHSKPHPSLELTCTCARSAAVSHFDVVKHPRCSGFRAIRQQAHPKEHFISCSNFQTLLEWSLHLEKSLRVARCRDAVSFEQWRTTATGTPGSLWKTRTNLLRRNLKKTLGELLGVLIDGSRMTVACNPAETVLFYLHARSPATVPPAAELGRNWSYKQQRACLNFLLLHNKNWCFTEEIILQ